MKNEVYLLRSEKKKKREKRIRDWRKKEVRHRFRGMTPITPVFTERRSRTN